MITRKETKDHLLLAIDVSNPYETLDQARELPTEELEKTLLALAEARNGLDTIGKGLLHILMKRKKTEQAVTAPLTGEEALKKAISELDLQHMKPMSEGN